MKQPFDSTPEITFKERDELLKAGSNGKQLIQSIRKGDLDVTPKLLKKFIIVEYEERPTPRQYVVDALFKALATAMQKQALIHYYGGNNA